MSFESICTRVLILLRFLFGKKSYLKDMWNILDFIIVVTSVISFFIDLDSLKALRTLRILRPLRLFSNIKSVGKMLNAIF